MTKVTKNSQNNNDKKNIKKTLEEKFLNNKAADLKELLGIFPKKEELSLELLFIGVYCVVSDFIKSIGGQQNLRRSNNNNPKFTDAEVITINIVGQLSQQNSQSAWHRYVRKNYLYLFPNMSKRPQYVKRTFHLHHVTCYLQQYLCHIIGANCGREFIIDSFPVELCNLQRIKSSSQPFQYDGANYGYCASKILHYYGYKCHLVTDLRGVPIFLSLTGANMSDLYAFEFVIDEMLKYKIVKSDTIYIGDKGYVGKEFQNKIEKNYGVKLCPMERNYNKSSGESAINELLKKSRKIIETSINLIAEELNGSRTKRRSIKGLISSFIQKITAFNMANLFNYFLEKPILRIKSFVY